MRHALVRRVWPVLWRATLLGFGLVAVHRQVRDGNDFPIYWQAARDLLAGRSPYDVSSGLHGYVYLPWFAWVLVPLALVPLAAAAWCWYVANLAFTWLAGRLLLASMRDAGVPTPPLTIVLAALPLAGLFQENLFLGQANLLLLLLVALTVRRAGNPAAHGGSPLGLAATLKMPAAVLAVPLVIRGRVGSLAIAALVVVAALALPLLAPGGVTQLGDWRAKVIEPAVAGTLQGSKIIDQSPQAALRRLLVSGPAFGDRAVNVASLDAAMFARVSRITSLVFLLGYVIVWWFAPRRGSPRALLLDLALGCCAMVQLTGFNLKAQFVVLLFPAWLAASLAWEGRWRTRRAALVVGGALFLLSQPGLVGRTASNWMLACSSMTVATVILAKVLAWQRLTVEVTPGVPAAAAERGD